MEPFEQTFLDHLTSLNRGIKKVQDKFWNRFLEIGLPQKNREGYHYVRLRELFHSRPKLKEFNEAELERYQAHLQGLIDPLCVQSHLVFINGCYVAKLSNTSALSADCEVLPLSKAQGPFGSFLNQRYQRLLEEEKDPFALLNQAFESEGVFLYFSPEAKVDALQIIQLVDSEQQELFLNPKIHVIVGKKAQANLLLSTICLGEKVWLNAAMDLTIEEQAQCSIIRQIQGHAKSWHFDAVRGTVKKSGKLEINTLTDGGKATRLDYTISLQGEEAEAALKGAWLLGQERQAHVRASLNHQEPSTRSLQTFKGALAGISRASFEGKIYVNERAQQTQAYQVNHNLLLSDKAIAYSRPNLEIFADDVKASHGATVGQLDEEALFYLKSRGIPLETAQQLCLKGFLEDVLADIPYTSLQSWAQIRALSLLEKFDER